MGYPFYIQEVIAVRRVIIAGMLVLSVLLTGCSFSMSSKPSERSSAEPTPTTSATVDDGSEPTEQSQACKEECSNQEVAVTGCDEDAGTVKDSQVTIDPQKLDGVAGVLELRVAYPAVCESIYWARFRPYASASANWVVGLKIDGKPYEDQASDQGPNVDGYTEGIYAAPGSDITYCVTQAKGDGDDKVCKTIQAVIGGG